MPVRRTARSTHTGKEKCKLYRGSYMRFGHLLSLHLSCYIILGTGTIYVLMLRWCRDAKSVATEQRFVINSPVPQASSKPGTDSGREGGGRHVTSCFDQRFNLVIDSSKPIYPPPTPEFFPASLTLSLILKHQAKEFPPQKCVLRERRQRIVLRSSELSITCWPPAFRLSLQQRTTLSSLAIEVL